MKDSNSNSSGATIGFTSLLTLLFIGLKLGKVINWSWWWVLSPIWISVGITIVVVATIFLVLKRK